MVDILKKRLKELRKDRAILKIAPDKEDLYFNSTQEVFEKIGGYFNMGPGDFFKKIRKKKTILAYQLCQYQIIEKNKEIFNDHGVWNLTAGLFKNSSPIVMRNYYEIEKSRELPTSEGKIIREVLSLFSGNCLRNLNQSKSREKLNPDEIVKKVCREMSIYFNLSQQDLFKNKNSLEAQLCFYRITEENKKLSGRENCSLTAKLLNTDYETVLYGYYQIDVLKDQNDSEGKIIKGILNLFKENS